jgi:hypothetical protein
VGRDPLLRKAGRPAAGRIVAAGLLGCLAATLPAHSEGASHGPEPPAFPLRIVRVGGPLDSPAVRRHLDFVVSIGFNALWVPGSRAGRWTEQQAPEGPRLLPEFLTLAGWCQERQIRLFVALNPVIESDGAFVFDRPDDWKRLRKFGRLLLRQAGVRDFVVSFQGAPLRLSELRDLMEFGLIAASAHLELTARLHGKLGSKAHLWLEPAVSNDLLLDDPRIRYSGLLVDGLRGLDPRIGIVWSGTEPASSEIRAAELAATRSLLGGRRLLLQDRFPANHGGGRLATALVLGPLRRRDPDIAAQVAGYLACPMEQLGASRLSLLTIADFLRAPTTYDADVSWQGAIDRIAGPSAAASTALKTQAMEWGGWIGERNYHTTASDNPQTAAETLRDPAATAAWQWPARRYPARMADLELLADEVFREELLEVMARRLAIARAVPSVRELRARLAAGRTDVETLVEQLRTERAQVRDQPTALLALDRFLGFSGVASVVVGNEPGEPR